MAAAEPADAAVPLDVGLLEELATLWPELARVNVANANRQLKMVMDHADKVRHFIDHLPPDMKKWSRDMPGAVHKGSEAYSYGHLTGIALLPYHIKLFDKIANPDLDSILGCKLIKTLNKQPAWRNGFIHFCTPTPSEVADMMGVFALDAPLLPLFVRLTGLAHCASLYFSGPKRWRERAAPIIAFLQIKIDKDFHSLPTSSIISYLPFFLRMTTELSIRPSPATAQMQLVLLHRIYLMLKLHQVTAYATLMSHDELRAANPSLQFMLIMLVRTMQRMSAVLIDIHRSTGPEWALVKEQFGWCQAAHYEAELKDYYDRLTDIAHAVAPELKNAQEALLAGNTTIVLA